MIDHFTKEQFESALPTHKETGARLWEYTGIHDGEHSYLVSARQGLFIRVRSSVHEDGHSAATGEDSIRCWLVNGKGEPMAAKVARWITRQHRWQERLTDTLRYLYKLSLTLQRCPVCSELKHARRVKKGGINQGRVFQVCVNKHGGIDWLPDCLQKVKGVK